MALSIKHPDADRLVRELSKSQGRAMTDVIIHALRAEIDKEKLRVRPPGLAARLLETGRRYQQLPILDTRSDAKIFGFDDAGSPL